ncbi:MAG TPA: MerR family transcriptional regulator [Pseudonocardia sp.]|nr:MerR family transcriptional regulator [Pseudonocardia sp.]
MPGRGPHPGGAALERLTDELLPGRTAGGQRTYADDAVERVELIQLLFAAGVPSATVVKLLPCIYSGTTTPAMGEPARTGAEPPRRTRPLPPRHARPARRRSRRGPEAPADGGLKQAIRR